ncbi:tetratricopeptide repeat protein [Calothrix sp. CCY 0018]|uniref:tetratricopeptide repeat protein n=1 Tax=Calothrix sp. CCY 0018 TaxID=3103864 RepID=UPI0039C5F29F
MGLFISLLIQILIRIYYYSEFLFWIIIAIIILFFLIGLIEEKKSSNSSTQTPNSSSNNQVNNTRSSPSTQTPNSSSNNQVNNTQSSTNATPQNIQWTEVGTYYSNNSQTSEQNNTSFDNDFLGGKNQKLNINELLKNLVGQKDRVSGEILQAGEKVYICEPCQLGYHKDSWEFLNKKCEQCKSSINKLYSLPIPITFTDIPQTQIVDSFNTAEDLLHSGLKKTVNKKYGEAIIDFTEALRFHSNFAEAYYYRGTTYYNLGNNQAAIDDLTQAISINPNYDAAYNDRGVAYHERGLMQLAIKDFTQALRINPNHASFYNNRGKAYYKLGDLEAAIKDYNRALTIVANYTEAQKNLDIARSQLDIEQRLKNNITNSNIPSPSTKVVEKYINVLDINAIYYNIGKTVRLKGKIASVTVDTEYKLINFQFSKNSIETLYAYVPRKSFSLFPNASSLTDKNVIISGEITFNRRNRPVIVINQPSQIKEIQE